MRVSLVSGSWGSDLWFFTGALIVTLVPTNATYDDTSVTETGELNRS